MRAKETRDNIEEHFKPIMDEIHHVEQESIPVISTDDIAHDLKLTCEISMIDGKMVNIIQGDSGSFCHYCDATREEANNLENLLNGEERSSALCKPPFETEITGFLLETPLPRGIRSDAHLV